MLVVLLLVCAEAAICAGVVEIEAIHGLDWDGGGIILRLRRNCANRYGRVEGGLGGNAREEVGEGGRGDDGGVAEVLEFRLDGSDGPVHLRLLHLLEG